MRKLLFFMMAVFLTIGWGYTQNIKPIKQGLTEDKNIVQDEKAALRGEKSDLQDIIEMELLKQKEADMMKKDLSFDRDLKAKTNPAATTKAMWDIEFGFSTTVGAHPAVATDGINFYIGGWQENSFVRYNMDGSNPVPFSVTGVAVVRSLTYDGEFFYGGNGGNSTIYKLDLANQTLVGTITSGGGNTRHLAYDPTLNGGAGGFWTGDWDTMSAISMTGTVLIPNSSTGTIASVYGSAYDGENNCLWLSTQTGPPNSTPPPNTGYKTMVQQFDLTTLALTNFSYPAWEDEPTQDGIAGGAFTYEADGKLLLVINSQVTPNYICVYEIAQLADPDSPAAVTNLVVTPGMTGALTATIAWTNPTLTFGGDPLTSITAVKVYHNDELIHTVTAPAPGSPSNHTVSVTAAGIYKYVVVPENAAGVGISANASAWVGPDLPGAPLNFTGVPTGADDEDVLLTWTAPPSGINGGWFDASTLTYNIVRNPGNVAVATGLINTTYTDNTLTGMGSYSYTITSINNAGTGGSATVAGTFGGQLSIPYYMGFENDELWELWAIVNDGNPGGTGANGNWQRYNDAAYSHGGAWHMRHYYHGTHADNDWVFSPSLPLEAGKTYKVKFWLRSYSLTSYAEKVALYFCSGQSPDATIGEPLWFKEDIRHNYIEYDAIVPVTTSGGYSFGFHKYSAANQFGIHIDDFSVTIVTEDPQIEVLPVAMGDVYNNVPGRPVVKQHQVKNSGGAPLTITGFTSASPEITVTGLPLTIPVGSTAEITVSVNGFGLPAGAFSGNFVLSSNDPADPEYTVAVSGNIISVPTFIDENWDDAAPAGWAYLRFTRTTGVGVNGTACVRANLYNSYPDGGVQTPLFLSGSDPIMSFKIKAHGWSAGPPSDQLVYGVFISTDEGETWDNIFEINVGDHPITPEFVPVFVDMTGYENELCIVQIVAQSVGSADLYVLIDDVIIGTMPAFDDLTAISVTGQGKPTVGIPYEYIVNIKNSSYTNTMAPGSYTVKLMMVDEEGDIELGTANGIEIDPLEVKQIPFIWTPTEVGVFFIYGVIECVTDENPFDNTTPNFKIDVQPEGTIAISIGNGTDILRIPANVYYRMSFSQTLYTPEDMGINGGTINSLIYNLRMTTASTNVTAVPIQIWMGETDITSLDGNTWVDPSTLTEVYFGTHNWSALQDYVVDIELDTPFEYNGGNLVIYTYRQDTGYANTNDGFYGHATGYPGKSILRYADSGTPNPMSPSTFGSLTQIPGFPNITIMMEAVVGSLSGVVYGEDGEPIAGAMVSVDGWEKTTDETGAFLYSMIVEGSYTITASKFGYYDASEVIDIVDGELTTQDLVLVPLPSFTVSGTVTGNDTAGAGLEGVEISLSGYNAYGPVTTNSAGFYTIPNVFDGHTYTLTATIDGYMKYIGEVEVDGDDVDFDFMMNEILYPVGSVTAVIEGNNVVVEWTLEDEGAFITFASYDPWEDGSGYQMLLDSEANAFGALNTEEGTQAPPASQIGLGFPSVGPMWRNTWGTIPAALYDWADYRIPEGAQPNYQNVPTNIIVNGSETIIVTAGTYDFCITNVDSPTMWIAGGTPPTSYARVNDFEFEAGKHYTFTTMLLGEGDGVSLVIADAKSGKVLENHLISFNSTQNIEQKPGTVRTGAININSKPVTPPAVQYPLYTSEGNASKVQTGFNVYRMLAGQDEEEWELVGPNVQEPTYTESHLPLAWGLYRWAVKAVYTGGVESVAKLSNALPIKYHVPYTVNITTNTGASPGGAVVTLTNVLGGSHEVYTATAPANGTVTFPNVFRGVYNMTITLAGFTTLTENDIDIWETGSGNFVVYEILYQPTNVVATEQDEDTVVITWVAPSGGSKPLTGYIVYRLKYGQPESEWIQLTPSSITALTYTDNQWGTLTSGVFVYAIKAVYTGNILAPAVFSNQVLKGLFEIAIGQGTVNNLKIPADIYYRRSFAQTLHFPAELGTNGGVINKLTYRIHKTDANNSNVAAVPIQIWLGETDQTTFTTTTWIDPTTLTEVYDGIHDFSTVGDYDVEIFLDTPYQYNGGNLVIYTYRKDTGYSSTNDGFWGYSEGYPGKSVRSYSDSGTANWLTPSTLGTNAVVNGFPNIKILMSSEGMGSITGVISNIYGPIEGAKVQIGIFTQFTNANGVYKFPALQPDFYDLEISCDGHVTAIIEDVEVLADAQTVANKQLDMETNFPVSGKVTGNDTNGVGIAGVDVVINGYAISNITATTDANGNYSFPYVFDGYTYTVKATYEGYVPHNGEFTVNGIAVVHNIMLIERLYPVAWVDREEVGDNVVVTWGVPMPIQDVEYRYDSGVTPPANSIGWNGSQPNSILGAAHRYEDATLTSMSWFIGTTSANVKIFALDAQGNLTTNVLYSANSIASVASGWTVYELPEPVSSPYGFFIGIGQPTASNMLVGVNNATAEWPFAPNTNFYSANPGVIDWVDLSTTEFAGNFMVRGIGTASGKKAYFGYEQQNRRSEKTVNSSDTPALEAGPAHLILPVNTDYPAPVFDPVNHSKVRTGYNVYRFLDGTPEADWDLLAEDTELYSHTDLTWSEVTAGGYYYAVKAVYTGNVESVAKLAPILYTKDMYADVTVNITLSCSNDPCNGAVVTLKNNDNDPNHTYSLTANNCTVEFIGENHVWKGTFTVTVTKEGYVTYTNNNVSIVEDEVTIPITLTEFIEEPFNLEMTEINECQHHFTWNEASLLWWDDMESYPNFAVSNIGEYTLIAGNSSNTYGFQGISFPNSGTSFAYIVFNPNMTTPPLDSEGWMPFSGEKALVSFANTTAPNNSWVILPKLAIKPGMEFSFMARSADDYDPQPGERFKVGVSTTGTAQANFTFISPPPYVSITDDQGWLEFSYDLSAYAGQQIHLAINCVSHDNFGFLVDDIFVGSPSAHPTKDKSRAFLHYQIYLDGVEYETTIETGYTFYGVQQGNHTAGVQAVYCSGVSDIIEYDFVSTCDDVYYTITATANVAAWGSVTGSGNYAEGATVELKANANSGYRFVNWTESGDVVETANPWTFTATTNRTVVAVFEAVATPTYTVQFIVKDAVTQQEIGGAWLWFDGELQSAYTAYEVTPGTHTYKLTHADYNDAEGEVVVENSDKTVTVLMDPKDAIKGNVLSSVVLYPNPFRNEINISNSDVVKSVQIMNATGQKVKQVIFDGKSISTGELASGIYFVTIESITGDKVVHKMVKK